MKAYEKHLSKTKQADQSCDFCSIDKTSEQFVSQTSSFKVIHNIFPYSVWDYQMVKDHLLIVPKKHIGSLADISQKAASEYIRLICGYELKGYSIYARAPGSVMKSIPHQHTHLIKLFNRKIKGLIYFEKPHIRIVIK